MCVKEENVKFVSGTRCRDGVGETGSVEGRREYQ